MSGRIYAINFVAVGVTVAQDLFSIAVAANEPVHILGYKLSQTSEVADAQEEMLRIDIVRGNTTVGTGGGAFTALPLDGRMGAAAAGCRINDTTEATAGTEQIMDTDAWNVRIPLLYLPIPELRIREDNDTNEFICVRLLTAPSDSITMNGVCWFEEG